MKSLFAVLWMVFLPLCVYGFNSSDWEKALVEFFAKSPKSKLAFVNKIIKEDTLEKEDLEIFLETAFQNWPEFIHSQEEEVEIFIDHLIKRAQSPFSQKLLQQIIRNASLPVWSKYYVQAWLGRSEYFFLSDNYDSVKYCMEAIGDRVAEFHEDIHLAQYYNFKGYVYYSQADFFNAILCYYKALNLVKEEYAHNLPSLYMNISNSFAKLESYSKADYYLDLGLKVADYKDSLSLLSNQARIKKNYGELEIAEEISYYLIGEFRSNNSELDLAKIYANLGNIYRRKGEYEKAHASLDSSDHICRALGIDIGLLNNRVNRSNVFLDQKQLDKALSMALALEKELEPSFLKEYQMANFENLHWIYEELGDAVKSNAYYRKWQELRSELLGSDTKSLVSEWELAVEREQNALAMAEQERIINQQIAHKKFIIQGTLALIGLAIFSFLLYRRQQGLLLERRLREKDKLEYALQMSHKEKMAELVKDLSMETITVDLLEKVKQIVQELPERHRVRFQDFFQEMGQDKVNAMWNNFDTSFLAVHEDFLNRLKTMAPDLSPTEIRICALMRLNLNTKEIATITHRSTGTIDNARSRIRKQLGLSEDRNLYDFLSSL